MLLFLVSAMEATTIMEDAEDGTIDGWRVRTGPADGINNVLDAQSNSRVIQLTGGGSYMLGATHGDNALNLTEDTTISWKMRTTRQYTIHVVVQTTEGIRFIFYTFSPNRGLLHGFENGIHHGLGASTIDGRWRTITRDLERDLKDAEPDNELIAVNGFIYNGGDGGMIDDIVLYTPDEIVYEDGESGIDGWIVSDNSPAGATINSIADNDRQGRDLQGHVISLDGSGVRNAYRLGEVVGVNAWNNRDQQLLQWRFRNFGPEVEVIDPRGIIRDPRAFEFRVFVETAEGRRHLLYTLGAEHRGIIGGGGTIHHGLGDDRIRGSVWAGDDPMNALGLWQTITRDLEEDIRDFEPNNRLIAVNGFDVRNSGLVDDIKMLSSASDEFENDDDDNDDNENPTPPRVVYESAANGNTNGWSIFANGSGEAYISNVFDEVKQSRVIKLSGEGKGDGYMFGARGGDNALNNREHENFNWSMSFHEDFTIYIAVETTAGRRYLTYTPRDDDRGLRGQYIRFGLGENANSGTWQTVTRNLSQDIQSFEPNNELVSINAFMVRGSGHVDDILSF